MRARLGFNVYPPPGIKAFFPSPYVIVQTRVTPWLQPPILYTL